MKIVLDACCNHVGSDYLIKRMIEMAALEAEYIKFQLYSANKLNTCFPNYKDRILEYKKMEITLGQLDLIFEQCSMNGIIPMFTIFDEERLQDLESYRNARFALKIASPDAHRTNMINRIINFFPDKLIIISTGMLNSDEIDQLICTFPKAEIMYCVSKYPTQLEDIDFEMMKKLGSFSDHTQEVWLAEVLNEKNIKLKYYEKHFILTRFLNTRDSLVSITPKELNYICRVLDHNKMKDVYKERWNENSVT